MAEEWKIGEAFIQFSTKGDVKGDVAKQQKAAADHEKEMTRLSKERDKQEAVALQNRKDKLHSMTSLATRGLGRLPFVGGAMSIADAGIAGMGTKLGAAGSAGVAAGAAALNYGIEGAGKASPQTMASMHYQMDRMQAGIGQTLVPAIAQIARVAERLSDKMGFAPLNNPQFSDFAAMRDRLQLAALEGNGGAGNSTPGWLATVSGPLAIFNALNDKQRAATGESLMSPISGLAHIGRSIMNALD